MVEFFPRRSQQLDEGQRVGLLLDGQADFLGLLRGVGSVVVWAKATGPVSEAATSNAPVKRALMDDLCNMIFD